jgi:hypothetical protein
MSWPVIQRAVSLAGGHQDEAAASPAIVLGGEMFDPQSGGPHVIRQVPVDLRGRQTSSSPMVL